MTRRTLFLSLALPSVGLASYTRYVEPEWLKLTHRHVALPGIAEMRQPVRLVHMADLHASHCVPNSLIEEAFALALDHRPDLICLTGDFVTSARGGYDARWYRHTLGELSRCVPTFATMGNHDGGVWSKRWKDSVTSERIRNLVAESGVEVLHNQRRELSFRGQSLCLVGVGDLWAQELDPAAAFGRLNQYGNVPTVLMSHNPDSKSLVADYPWDLMLSGHTHGGQVVVPVVGISPAPVNDKRYVYGLLPWASRQIHVTSGVGNARGVRFNCRPEVAVLDFIPQTQSPAPAGDRLYS